SRGGPAARARRFSARPSRAALARERRAAGRRAPAHARAAARGGGADLRHERDLVHVPRAGARGVRFARRARGPGPRAPPHAARAERSSLRAPPAGRDRRAPADPSTDGMDVPAPLAQAIASIKGPAYLLDRIWNARAWNAFAARLFVGWLDQVGERNLLRYVF